jgi:hypothetical protein
MDMIEQMFYHVHPMAWTKDDQRRFNATYYRDHRDEEIARVLVRQRATLELLRNLRRVPCADCGGTFPPYCMDFDHRDPAQKSFSLAAGKSLLKNRTTLLEEVAKCDVVCANCHRIRTCKAFMAGTLRPIAFVRDRFPAATPQAQKHRKDWHDRVAVQMKVLDEFRSQACADCGERFPGCSMEFDHRDPARKEYVVSQMPGRYKLAAILAEIAKCDVVCANCHRIRTHRRRIIENAQQLRLIREARTSYKYAA